MTNEEVYEKQKRVKEYYKAPMCWGDWLEEHPEYVKILQKERTNG